jgi:hypothetical protein
MVRVRMTTVIIMGQEYKSGKSGWRFSERGGEMDTPQ